MYCTLFVDHYNILFNLKYESIHLLILFSAMLSDVLTVISIVLQILTLLANNSRCCVE